MLQYLSNNIHIRKKPLRHFSCEYAKMPTRNLPLPDQKTEIKLIHFQITDTYLRSYIIY